MVRRFETEPFQREWLAHCINGTLRDHGPDIGTPAYAVELKCRFAGYTPTFAVHDYQVRDFPSMVRTPCLWAFLLYDLDGLRSNRRKIPASRIEAMITNRRVWIVPWDFVTALPVSSPKTGPYRYVKESILAQQSYEEFAANDARWYVERGVERSFALGDVIRNVSGSRL